MHDNWWQTETGGIMISNFAATEIRPGSMGRPLPGVEAGIVARDAQDRPVVRDGEAVLVTAPDASVNWPCGRAGRRCSGATCMRRSATAAASPGGWYLTGDLARRDADGYYWFVGRGDDVIKSSGHLIGPFEVESSLMEHAAVAEAGVIGVPDPVAGEVVKAFVELRPGVGAPEELQLEIIGFARKRLGPAVAPRLLDFTTALPRTAAARSCGACSKPANSGCRRATPPRSRPRPARRNRVQRTAAPEPPRAPAPNGQRPEPRP